MTRVHKIPQERYDDLELAIKELGPDKVDIIVPSVSILAEPPVSVVDRVVDRRGSRKLAEAYLQYLYTDEAQDLIAKFFRQRSRRQHVYWNTEQCLNFNLDASDIQ